MDFFTVNAHDAQDGVRVLHSAVHVDRSAGMLCRRRGNVVVRAAPDHNVCAAVPGCQCALLLKQKPTRSILSNATVSAQPFHGCHCEAALLSAGAPK